MKRNYILIIWISFLVSHFGFAQEKKLEQANKKYKRYAFIDAQKIFLKVANEGHRSDDLFQKLGNSYYFNADYSNAAKWYGELMADYVNKVDSEYYFRYAQSLKAIKKYDESDRFMKKFYTFNGGDSRAQNYEKASDYLRKISFQSGRYKIKNLKSNSTYSEFGPRYYGERLLFASSRDTGVFAKRIHEWNNRPFLDLYVGKIKEDSGEIVEVKKFSKKLNTKFHESTPAFSNDLKTVYFTRNNYNKGKYRKSKEGVNKLKIYKAIVNENGSWSKAKSISINSDEYSVSHPTLSPDNKKLFFTSDMPGGFGATDIYEVAINEDGTFDKPKNLGATINTGGREIYPHVSESGDLYFASNGHIGLGGLDLYVIHLNDNGSPGEIVNLGEPANSPKDDFAFIVKESTKTGYFSSNRNGGNGDDDLYRFVQLEDVKEECEILLTGTILDKDTKEILQNVTVTLLDTNNTIVETIKIATNGYYEFKVACDKNYFLRIEKQKYNTAEKLIATPTKNETLTTNFELEKTIKEASIGQDLGKILNLNPIYFDFDSFGIRKDAAVELAKIIAVMQEYPTMKIDVRSHTDSVGDDNYNLTLSENRNKSTVNYIIKKGEIAKERLSGKGYGETQPVNKCANGVPCTIKQHQLNRRSEFIILAY